VTLLSRGTAVARRGVLGGVREAHGGRAAIRLRVAGVVLLLVHLALVGWLTLRPVDVTWVTAANLRPLAVIRADLAHGPLYAAREIGEGLALLAPLGVLLPVAGGRLQVSPVPSLVRTTAAGALISLAIELVQTGVPGRVADVDAVILNTAGVALAHMLCVPLGRNVLRHRVSAPAVVPQGDHSQVPQDDPAQGVTPTIPRVGIAP
jgi:glycopeptide antibiotics resistance protein